jgi:hypothetical protein
MRWEKFIREREKVIDVKWIYFSCWQLDLSTTTTALVETFQLITSQFISSVILAHCLYFVSTLDCRRQLRRSISSNHLSISIPIHSSGSMSFKFFWYFLSFQHFLFLFSSLLCLMLFGAFSLRHNNILFYCY